MVCEGVHHGTRSRKISDQTLISNENFSRTLGLEDVNRDGIEGWGPERTVIVARWHPVTLAMVRVG